jgi:hypothetical protein
MVVVVAEVSVGPEVEPPEPVPEPVPVPPPFLPERVDSVVVAERLA